MLLKKGYHTAARHETRYVKKSKLLGKWRVIWPLRVSYEIDFEEGVQCPWSFLI
jgi:hypothetical protein